MDNRPAVQLGFSTAMRPVGYAECVSVTDGPPVQQKSAVTLCDFEVDARCKETVNIGPGLSPCWFQSKVVCHKSSSKKNFRTAIDYVPKMKPLKYGSTYYARPKHLIMTYMSYLDYNANDSQKWYTTTVQVVPSSNSHNSVNNFQLKRKTGSLSSDEELDNSPVSVTVESRNKNEDPIHDKDNADINMNTINQEITLKRVNQPTILTSSGPDDNSDSTEQRMSHRTKMVVRDAPTQRMNNEDYVVYLNGYASTGDVTSNGYPINDDTTNGYYSDGVSEV